MSYDRTARELLAALEDNPHDNALRDVLNDYLAVHERIRQASHAPVTVDITGALRETLTLLSKQEEANSITATPQRTRPAIDIPETTAHFHPQVWINDEAVDVDVYDEASCVLSEEDAAWVAMNLGDNADFDWILTSDTSPIPSWVRDHIRLYPCTVTVTGEHINTENQTLTEEFLAARDATAEHTVMSTSAPVTTLTEEQVATVLEFINDRPRFVSALKQCSSADHDYWRWSGHAEARRHLAEQLGITPPTTLGLPATHRED